MRNECVCLFAYTVSEDASDLHVNDCQYCRKDFFSLRDETSNDAEKKYRGLKKGSQLLFVAEDNYALLRAV